MSSNHQQAREALGARLRELRRMTGLNGKQFAAKLGWYGASRVSKLELGQQTPSDQDLISWTTACDAPDALAELRIQLNAVESLYTEFRRQLYAGVHVRQRELLDLEAETTIFRGFVCAAIPGLLQTPEYARHIFEKIAALNRVPPEIDEAVHLRMQRQEILYGTGKEFHIVMTEAVLRYSITPPEIMLRQLEKLLVTSTLRNVRLGIIPFAKSIDEIPWHGFWIDDDRLVTVETFAAELRLTHPSEIELYNRTFDRMAQNALYDDQARHIILHTNQTLGSILHG